MVVSGGGGGGRGERGRYILYRAHIGSISGPYRVHIGPILYVALHTRPLYCNVSPKSNIPSKIVSRARRSRPAAPSCSPASVRRRAEASSEAVPTVSRSTRRRQGRPLSSLVCRRKPSRWPPRRTRRTRRTRRSPPPTPGWCRAAAEASPGSRPPTRRPNPHHAPGSLRRRFR